MSEVDMVSSIDSIPVMDNSENNGDVISYEVIPCPKDIEDPHFAVRIGNTKFINTEFRYVNVTFTGEDGKVITEDCTDNVEDINVLYEYEVFLFCCENNEPLSPELREEFENVLLNILLDIVINRKDFWQMENQKGE